MGAVDHAEAKDEDPNWWEGRRNRGWFDREWEGEELVERQGRCAVTVHVVWIVPQKVLCRI